MSIKSKLLLLLLCVVSLLGFVCLSLTKELHNSHRDVARLQHNTQALCDTIRVYRAVDGLNAYQIRRLEMSKQEAKKTNTYLKNEIINLGIKLKELQSADRTKTKTKYVFVPDTVEISIHDTIYRSLEYYDSWTNFRMDRYGVNMQIYDTVYCIRHQKVKKFLWWTRRKDSYITIHNKNPHSEVTAVQSIDIIKN